jgi:uncharacterized DUF497 family protein
MTEPSFAWDEAKDRANLKKHGMTFADAQHAFLDPRRVIAEDVTHSTDEQRWYCFGLVGGRVMTVRFTWLGGVIRIFGAGWWRKGGRIYEQTNGR